MSQIILTSSIAHVGKEIAKHMIKSPSELKTVFITTAAEDEKGETEWLTNDRNGLLEGGFNLFDYTITGKTPEDLEKDLSGVDVIHVNGGNTFYLLLQARKSGFDTFIKKFLENGGIYIGSSAGSQIAGPDIEIIKRLEVESFDKELQTFESFGLVDFVIFPHWGSKTFREVYLNQRIEFSYKTGNKIILLTDTQYILVGKDGYKIIDIEK